MLSSEHIFEFCNTTQAICGVSFRQLPSPPHAIHIGGEYFTRSGQTYTVMLRVIETEGELKIWDGRQQLVFNKKFTNAIPQRTINFIKRSIELN